MEGGSMSMYDNISGDNLATTLKKTTEKANRADFCIGYFNIRGWDMLSDRKDYCNDYMMNLVCFIINYDIKFKTDGKLEEK
jgi:hypothetical protein